MKAKANQTIGSANGSLKSWGSTTMVSVLVSIQFQMEGKAFLAEDTLQFEANSIITNDFVTAGFC